MICWESRSNVNFQLYGDILALLLLPKASDRIHWGELVGPPPPPPPTVAYSQLTLLTTCYGGQVGGGGGGTQTGVCADLSGPLVLHSTL